MPLLDLSHLHPVHLQSVVDPQEYSPMNHASYFDCGSLDVVDLRDGVLDAVVVMMCRIMSPSGKMSGGRVGNSVEERMLMGRLVDLLV